MKVQTGQFVRLNNPNTARSTDLPDTGKVVQVIDDTSAWVSFMVKVGRSLVLKIEKIFADDLPEVIDETNNLIAKIKLLFSSLPERIEWEDEIYKLTLRPAAGRDGLDSAAFEYVEAYEEIKDSQTTSVLLKVLRSEEGETMSEARRNLKWWLKENNYI